MNRYEQDHQEPKSPFTVEMYIGAQFKLNQGYELWQSDIEDYQDAVSEAQILEDHNFEWRIIDANNKQFAPNLKARRVA